MNIYQKLIEVRKVVHYLQKENSGKQYNYVSSSQVLSNVRSKMDEVGLLLIPAIVGHNLIESTVEYIEGSGDNKRPKKTTTYFTELDMTMTWVNAEKPEETIVCPWYAQGVDIAGEKGVGKALTYGEKYFMLKQFNIATDKDDPDAFQEKHNGTPPEQPKQPTTKEEQKPPKQEPKPTVFEIISEPQAKRLFALAKGNQDIVKDVISQYGYEKTHTIKKIDYNKICDLITDTVNKTSEPEFTTVDSSILLPWERNESINKSLNLNTVENCF